jgi:DNA-binding NarL/FixJ family response regulator
MQQRKSRGQVEAIHGAPRPKGPAFAPGCISAFERAFAKSGRLTATAIFRQAFDWLAIPVLFDRLPDLCLLECFHDLHHGRLGCQALEPDIALVDLSFPSGGAYALGEALSTTRCVRAVAFFDTRFAFWRAYRALSVSKMACYLTRDLHPLELCDALRGRRLQRDQTFLTDICDLNRFDDHRLFSLSKREMDVFQLLGSDFTVRQISTKLRLAESTVDNHKQSLMKKLGIHRSQELLRIAVDIGMHGSL